MAFVVPAFNTILQQAVSDYQAIATSQGFTVNPDPNSEVYARLATFSQGLSVVYYLASVQLQAQMVDTATGADLDRLANNRNIFRKGATPSQGFIQFLSASPQTIVQGSLLNGPNSLQYQVSITGVYNNAANVPVESVNTGANTNLEVGETLTWINQPFNAQPTVPVSLVITGGTDAETDDALRARVLAIIQFPPQAGNGSQLINLAGTIDPVVQAAFVYGNYNGAGTLLITLVAAPTSSYIGRDIPHLVLDNYIPGTVLSGGIPSPSTNIQYGLINDGTTTTPYNKYAYTDSSYTVLKNTGSNLSNDTSAIDGQLPLNTGNSFATAITTVNNLPTAISLALALPGPVGISNNISAGSGFVNAQTWPNPDGVAVFNFCQVTAVTSSTVFTVQAASLSNTGAIGPTIGATKIGWVNRSDAQNTGWLVNMATVIAATDNNDNTWTITIDNPFSFPSGQTDFYGNTGLAVGDFIFPAAVNDQNYLNSLISSFSNLGPGAMTTSAGLLSLGATRFPASNTSFPNVIDDRFCQNVDNNSTEVQVCIFVNNNGVYAMSSPAVVGSSIFNTPPAANAPPNIWIPCQIGLYDNNMVNYLV